MKQTIVTLLTVIIFVPMAQSQVQYVWLRLANDRVIINATFERLSGDSLLIAQGNKKITVLVENVKQIRFIPESSLLTGMVIGAGTGIAGGWLVGTALHSADPNSWSPASAALAFGIIGGVVGSVLSSFSHPDDIVDVSGKSTDEKLDIIQKMIKQE